MERFFCLIIVLGLMSLNASAQNSITKVSSKHTVDETVSRMKNILTEKGLKVFTVIEHARGAKSVSMELRPTTLILFGNPTIGTKLMQCDQRVGIDLPMKFLVWEDKEGVVWVGYRNPVQLNLDYSLEDCEAVLTNMNGALAKFADLASQ